MAEREAEQLCWLFPYSHVEELGVEQEGPLLPIPHVSSRRQMLRPESRGHFREELLKHGSKCSCPSGHIASVASLWEKSASRRLNVATPTNAVPLNMQTCMAVEGRA